MAERIERTEVRMEKVTHHFYCDLCNERVGSSDEDGHGWYCNPYEREVGFHIPQHGWLRARKCLCDSCFKDWLATLGSELELLGFRKEGK